MRKSVVIAILVVGWFQSSGHAILAGEKSTVPSHMSPRTTPSSRAIPPPAPKAEPDPSDDAEEDDSVPSKPVQKDFKDYAWGTTKQQIQQGEATSTLKREFGDDLVYNGSIGYVQCEVKFTFLKDKLVRGEFEVEQEHASDRGESVLRSHAGIIAALKDKYGAPAYARENWEDAGYRSVYDSKVQAILHERLELEAKWTLARTIVYVRVFGMMKHDIILLSVQYTSKKDEKALKRHEAARQKQDKDAAANQFKSDL